MSQAAVILDPVTYGGRRRSLANALAQAGLAEQEAISPEDALTAPQPQGLIDMEADTTGVFEVIDIKDRTRPTGRTRTETQSRKASTWMPIGYSPEPLSLLSDPQTASELPWLKAKRKGRFYRALKVFTAWIATLLVTGAILAGTAHVMGLYPWPKELPLESVARH